MISDEKFYEVFEQTRKECKDLSVEQIKARYDKLMDKIAEIKAQQSGLAAEIEIRNHKS